MQIPRWLEHNHNLRWLLGARMVRSLAQGFLSVCVPLYVVTLGYSGVQLGALLALAAVGSAVMTVAAGFLGDRWGRRRMTLVICALSVVGTAGYAVSHSFAALAVVSILSTFGRGGGAASGAAWGPFFPAVQPLVAASCSPEDRNSVFSGLAVCGAVAAAAGSALAAVPARLHAAGMAWVPAYHVMFWFGAVIALANLVCVLPIEERREVHGPVRPTRHAWSVMGRLSITNAVNGVNIGLLGPLQTYWFYARFGAGPAELGALFTATNLLSILPYLGAARVAERLGAVVTVTWSRMVGVALLVVQALSPTLGFADVVYLVRSVAILLSVPIRQSYVMGITEERSRSTVAAVGSLPSQATSSISPAVGAYLMESWTLEAPLWLAVFFQSLNSLLYYRFFRSEVPPEERNQGGGPPEQGIAAGGASPPGGAADAGVIVRKASQGRFPAD